MLDESDCHETNTPCGFDSFNCKSSCCLLKEGCVLGCNDYIKGASPTNLCHYLIDPNVCDYEHDLTSASPIDSAVVPPLTTSVDSTTPKTTTATPTASNPFPSTILWGKCFTEMQIINL